MISGYTDAAEQRRWKERCIADARHQYDQAFKKLSDIASQFAMLEDDLVCAGTGDPEDARDIVAGYTDTWKKATEALEEVLRWKMILKNEYGQDP